MLPQLSLVVPCYNDSDTLRRHLPVLQKYLVSLGIEYEVILSDDGSRDVAATEKIAAQFGFRLVSAPRNQGKGAAVRRGVFAARGEYIVFMDSDIPFEVESVGAIYRCLAFEKFDLAVGDRNLPESNYHATTTLTRKLGSHVISFFVGFFLTRRFFDTQCGLKGFRAEVARDLFGVGVLRQFAFDVELLYVAIRRDYDIKRLPVQVRSHEPSHVRPVRDGLRILADLLRIVCRYYLGGYQKTVPASLPSADSRPPSKRTPFGKTGS